MERAGSSLIAVKCALCGADDAAVVMPADDYYNRDGLTVVRCGRCGLAYTNPRRVDQSSIYTDNDSPHTNPAEREKRRKRSTAAFRVEKITRRLSRTGSLLEIGCGDCVFLEAAASAGWKVVGIDLCPSSEEKLRPMLGLDIRTARVEDLDPSVEQFEVVAAWDVLEHVTDPVGMLRMAGDMLVPNGLIVLRVPNFAAYRIFRPNWQKRVDQILRRKRREYDTETHIFHFDTSTLTRVVESAGYQIIDISPGWDYAFSRPKSLLSKIDQARSISRARKLFRRTGENSLPEIVVYARKVDED